MNHPFRSMFIVVALCVVVLLVLQFAALPAKHASGFQRIFLNSTALAPVDTLDLQYDSYYVVGHTRHMLYLGNLVAPRNLLAVHAAKLDTQHIIFQLNNSRQLKFWQVKVKVDSPHVYLFDGAVPALFKGTLRHTMLDEIGKGMPYFLDIIPMSENNFAVRSISPQHEAELGHVCLNPLSTVYHPELLQKQVDGIFCTEGTLHYDANNDRLLYLYAYRNQFLILDSGLNLLHTHKTIDTISHADIKVSSISSSQSTTLSSPPRMVNYHSALWNDFLLVHSALPADNEEVGQFKKKSVIDVYRMADGLYQFSFYIPLFRDKPLLNFRIAGHSLMVLYERHLITYPIPNPLLKLNTPDS